MMTLRTVFSAPTVQMALAALMGFVALMESVALAALVVLMAHAEDFSELYGVSALQLDLSGLNDEIV
jgi:hypothetical protein